MRLHCSGGGLAVGGAGGCGRSCDRVGAGAVVDFGFGGVPSSFRLNVRRGHDGVVSVFSGLVECSGFDCQ